EVSELSPNRSTSGPAPQTLRLACHRPLATAVLPKALARFAQAYPQFQLAVQAGISDEAIRKVENGAADVAIYLGMRAPKPSPDLLAIKAGKQSFCFVVGPHHELAPKKIIKLDELAAWPFIRGDHHSMYAQDITSMLANAGIAATRVSSRAT